jgi:hypothetical protein
MPPVRRLPVLQDASTSDPDRPAWHWAAIGCAFIFSIWVPLAMVTNWAGQRVVERMLGDLPPDELGLRLADASSADRLWLGFVLTVLPVLAYALSCWASGALVGRFGAKAGPREAAIAGACAALGSAALTLARTGVSSSVASLLLLAPVGIGAAWLGARFGVAKRIASVNRPPTAPTRHG